MPTFRLTSHEGHTSVITATRVLVSVDEVRFQVRDGGNWTPVSASPLDRVARVERQLTEVDGRRRYVDDRQVRDALSSRAQLQAAGAGR